MRNLAYFAMAMMLLAFAVIMVSRAQTPDDGMLREFRPIGGARNNLLHPQFDATPGRPELAIAPPRLDMATGPNPRVVSNTIAGGVGADGDDAQTTDTVASAWLYVFGQFVEVPARVFLGAGQRPRRKPLAPAAPIDNHGRLGVPFIVR